MSRKLYEAKQQSKPVKLSSRLDVPFIISFKYPLKNGYTFAEMRPEDNKAFQSFLNKVSNMTFNQVDTAHRKKSDVHDLYNGQQVIHYGVSGTFRIHGVIENSRFKVIRLDPRHKFHS